MKKNILIYSAPQLWSSHLKGSLEIACRNLTLNNNVFFLNCDKSLSSCPANHEKSFLKCVLCRNEQSYVIKKFFDGKVKNIDLKLKYQIKNFTFKDYNDFKNFKLYNVPFGNLISSELTTFFRNDYINYDDIKKIIDIKLSNAISLYRKSIDVIKKNKIDEVYVWNGRRSTDGPVIYAARKLNKKFFSFISSIDGTKLIIRESEKVHSISSITKEIKLIDFKKEFNSEKSKKIKIEKISNKLFLGKKLSTILRGFEPVKKNLKKIDIYSKKPILTIFTSTLWEFSSLGREWDIIFDKKKYTLISILDYLINHHEIIKKFKIVIKWHPNHNTASSTEIFLIDKFISKNKHVTHLYSKKIDPYHLAKKSSKIITFGSTLAAEVAYKYKIKSILIGSAYYKYLDFTVLCTNLTHLKKILKSNLKLSNKGYLDSQKYLYWLDNRGAKPLINLNHFLKNSSVDFNSKLKKMILFLKSLLSNFYKK